VIGLDITKLLFEGILMLSWKNLVMIGVGLLLLWFGIKKQYEPALLVPIGFSTILVNIPPHVLVKVPHGQEAGGLFYYLLQTVRLEIVPPLIFLGVGALTDFTPLLANPLTFLLGAAAQFGIFAALYGAIWLGFSFKEAASIGIIGGADGPTTIFLTAKLAPHILGPVAVAAYSYMSLVPLIQPPVIKLLTSRDERRIKMPILRNVSREEKILFPIVVTIVTCLLIPDATPLVGMLMFGNLLRECGVVERLSTTVQNAFIDILTIILGLAVGATMRADTFLTLKTIKIVILGAVAFAFATAAGVLFAKFMNLFLKDKINPMIGAAGVSAVPMSARVVQRIASQEDPSNFILMHAMGPNVAGVIGSAVVAGYLLKLFG